MIATRPRPRARTAPRWPALPASVALHAAILAAFAAIPAGVIAARRGASGPERPAAATWAPRAAEAETVVAVAPALPNAPMPRAAPEFLDAAALDADARLGDAPRVLDGPAAPVERLDPAPELRRRTRDAVSPRAGRGDPGRARGPASGAGGAAGAGASGQGGADGHGGSGALVAGLGRGSGGDGPGSLWAAQSGATRGPSIVGALPAPSYPAKARSRGWEGRVVLVLTVGEDGRVLAAEVAESSGRAALDDAALEAARGWTFSPALRDGEPVAGTLRVPVRFELTP